MGFLILNGELVHTSAIVPPSDQLVSTDYENLYCYTKGRIRHRGPWRKLGFRRAHGGRLVRTRKQPRVKVRYVAVWKRPKVPCPFTGSTTGPYWHFSGTSDPMEFDG